MQQPLPCTLSRFLLLHVFSPFVGALPPLTFPVLYSLHTEGISGARVNDNYQPVVRLCYLPDPCMCVRALGREPGTDVIVVQRSGSSALHLACLTPRLLRPCAA